MNHGRTNVVDVKRVGPAWGEPGQFTGEQYEPG